jgi:DNA-binding NarL/FixJ family response regulator
MFSSEVVEAVALSPALVVENDTAMQERLRYILSTLGCDEPQISWADDPGVAMQLLEKPSFRVVLVDIGLPGDEGIELIEWLQAHHPQVPVVAISASRSEEAVFSALRAGAVAYILKERDDLELSIGLRSIEQGGATIDTAIARRILAWHAGHASEQGPRSEAALTPQEHKTLELVVQGLGHRDIAETLAVPRLAVECRIKRIYRKLALGSHGEAAHMAGGHALMR